MTTSSDPRAADVETELKLALPASQVPLFERLMARRRSVPVRRQLLTRYFDTPDFALAGRGVALRLRRVGRRWLQTLKVQGERGGGLSRREEYETPVARGALDWARFAPAAQAQVPEALRDQLEPLFETRFRRSAWQVRGLAGARIEVALDVGAVHAGQRTLALCEVELELQSGRSDALFALALACTEQAPGERLEWLPLDASKAERGVRLARGERVAPQALAPVRLAGRGSVRAGFVAICRACLAQFSANLPGVLHDEDIEYVHQARVALHRLRVALRLYRRVCPLPQDGLLAGLRALARALGPARDWDVLCSATLPAIEPGFDDPIAWRQMMQAMTSHRMAARCAMQGAIVQARPAAWLLTFHRWLAQQPSANDLAGSAEQHPALQPWAAHALQAGHKKLVRGARGFERQSPRERHALRLFVKRQRYASEFFETLAAARSHAKYQGILHDLQTSLGRANDIHIARTLLDGALRGDPDLGTGTAARGAVSFALGWLARQGNEPTDRATLKALKALKKRQAPGQGE